MSSCHSSQSTLTSTDHTFTDQELTVWCASIGALKRFFFWKRFQPVLVDCDVTLEKSVSRCVVCPTMRLAKIYTWILFLSLGIQYIESGNKNCLFGNDDFKHLFSSEF